ncbi:MAG TPA: DUF2292 domain-containing protein [Bacillales bacterium]|nr:DUF2292 domain-containing protein [Bacillales bacterium]
MLNLIKYGSISFIIKDGKVIQIEKHENVFKQKILAD